MTGDEIAIVDIKACDIRWSRSKGNRNTICCFIINEGGDNIAGGIAKACDRIISTSIRNSAPTVVPFTKILMV